MKTYDPHVFLLHLIGLDSAQHNDGPGSPESRQTLKEIDAMVGELHDAVRQAGRADMTTMAVVSDRGFLPLQQQLQPNAALKQAGLLTVNERCAVTSWRAYYHSSGGRRSVGVIRMTQIAPTLAGILGVSLAPDAGAPLDLKAPRATAR